MAKYALSTYCIPGLFQALAAEETGGAERKESPRVVGAESKVAEYHKVPTTELNFESKTRVWSHNKGKDKREWMLTFSGEIDKTSN